MESNCLAQTHDVLMQLCYVHAIHRRHHRHYSMKSTGNWRHDGLNLGYPTTKTNNSVSEPELFRIEHIIVAIYTICSLLPSFWLGFCWLLDKGGVVDEHVFMFGGVDVVGELPEQPTPLTECWYIIESPGKINVYDSLENVFIAQLIEIPKIDKLIIVRYKYLECVCNRI